MYADERKTMGKYVNSSEIQNQVQSVHISKLTTLASLASHSEMAKEALQRAESNGYIPWHSSAIDALLSPAYELERLLFSLTSLE